MRPASILAFLFLAAAGLLAFPIGDRNSGVFYLSLSFFIFSLLVSSAGTSFSKGLSSLGLSPEEKRLPSLFLWGLAAFACAVAASLAVSALLYLLGFLDTAPVQEKILSLPLTSVAVAITLAPLGEEALFRGLLFRKMKEFILGKMGGKRSSWNSVSAAAIAAVASSLVFASLHFAYGSFAEIAAAFLVGIVFCAFTQKTGSLIPALFGHALFNTLSIFSTIACAAGICPF